MEKLFYLALRKTNYQNTIFHSLWKFLSFAAIIILSLQESYAQVSVTATAGTLGPTTYTTLGQALAAINVGTHQGAVTVSITATTAEGATTAFLNASTAGSANYTSVLIQPTTDNVSVVGTGGTAKSLLILNGADNVTINGTNPNTTHTNMLTFTNSNSATITATAVIRLGGAPSPGLGCTNITIENCNIHGNTTNVLGTVTEFGIYGGLAVSASATAVPTTTCALTATATGPYTNVTIQNNVITNCAEGIFFGGNAATLVPGLQIRGNTIGSPTTGNYVFGTGINLSGATSAVISNNTIQNIISSNGSTGTTIATIVPIAINLCSNVTSITVANNIINKVQCTNTGGEAARGIVLTAGNGHIIYNNFVINVEEFQAASTGTLFGAFAIYVGAGTGHIISFNSLTLNGADVGGTSAGTEALLGIAAASSTGMTIENNIFDIENTGFYSGSQICGLYTGATGTSAMNLTMNNNAYFVTSSGTSVGMAYNSGSSTLYSVANFNAAAITPATNMRAYTSTLSTAGTNDNASKATTTAAPFISSTNLNINTSSSNAVLLFDTGTPVSGITTDINGTTRNATTPCIGADEFTTPACSGTPAPGNTISTANPVCPGISFTLTLQNSTIGTGVTYQWQSSTLGTFTGTGGDVLTNLGMSFSQTTSQTSPLYYQCIVTCTNGGLSGTSTPLLVTMSSFINCYCTPPASVLASSQEDWIGYVAVGTLANTTSSYPSGSYLNIPSSTTTTNLTQGVSNSITLTCDLFGGYFDVFVDLNQDGIFQTSERLVSDFILGGGSSSGTFTGTTNFTIPVTALTGATRMRVRYDYDYPGYPNLTTGNNTGAESQCGQLYEGTTEDFTITIVAAPPCSSASGGTITPSTLSLCASSTTTTLVATGVTTGVSGITYQWMVSNTSGGPYSPVSGGSGSNTPSYTTPNNLSAGIYYYVLQPTCANCSCATLSNEVAVTVLAVPVVSASTSAAICAGGTLNFTGSVSCGCTVTGYSWTGPNGFSSTLQSPSILNAPNAATGTYTFIADNGICASSPSTTTASVYPQPTINVTPANTAGCSATVVNLTAGPGPLPTGYCTTATNCTSDQITNVTFATINRTSVCDGGYSVWSSPNPVLIPGNTYTLSVTATASGTNTPTVAVYIDYNQNSSFEDAGEKVLAQTSTVTNPGTVTTSVTIPLTATPGQTLLRCKSRRNSTAINSCTTGINGEIEDYYVTISSPAYTWAPSNNLNTTTGATVTATPTASVTYTVTATDPTFGCTSTALANITVGGTPSIALNVPASLCIAGSKTLTASVTGAVPPYSYFWTTGESTASITVTPPSVTTYVVTVTDNCGSTQTASTTINQAPSVAVSSSTPSVCLGSGTTLSASSSNDPNYTYVWTPGNLTGATISVSPLATTTYTVSAVDNTSGPNSGCAIIATDAVSVNPLPVLNLSPTSATICAGTSVNLTASLPTSGDVNTYTFAQFLGTWNQITGGTQLENLASAWDDNEWDGLPIGFDFVFAGTTYTTFSLDDNGAIAMGNTVNSFEYCPTEWVTDGPNSYGICGYMDDLTNNGNAATEIRYQTIGTAPNQQLVVQWLHAYHFEGSTSDDWNFQIVLNQSSNSVQVIWGPVTNVTTGLGENNCVDANGESGAVGLIGSGISDANLRVVTNGTNTWATSTAASSVTTTNICDFSSTNVPPTGLTWTWFPPVGGGSFSWSPFASLSADTGSVVTATPPATQTYTVLTTDNNGCTGTATATISVILPPTAALSGTTNVTCNGGSNGSATVSVTSGTGPYTYHWSNGTSTTSVSTSNTVGGLIAGTYSVTVSVGNTCSAIISNINVTQPAVLSPNKVVNNISCNGANNGSVTVSPTGGTPGYSYAWSNGAITSAIINLSINLYSVTITDSRGCTVVSSTQLTQPTVFSTSSSVAGNVSCNGGANGSVSVSAGGGTPPYSGTGSITGLSAGSFTFTVTDSRGCTSNTSLTVTQPSAVTATAIATANVSCNGGSNGTALVAASGGTAPYSGTGTFNGLSAGSYTYIITDSKGCTATAIATISQPSAINVSAGSNTPVCSGANINLTSSASGGTGTLTYSWSGPNAYNATGANPPAITNAGAANIGPYSINVTDANSCTTVTTTTVTVVSCVTILNLRMFTQGYYLGSSTMNTVLLNENVCPTCFTQVDTFTVEVHSAVSPYGTVESVKIILNTDGTGTAVFSAGVAGNSYYIAVHHRNTIQTWSKLPYAFATSGNFYDFSSSVSQAYSSSNLPAMVQVDFSPDVWAFYTGDINQDDNIDLIDFPPLDYGINNGLFGYYASDLDGDGNVDLLDFPVLDANINAGIFAQYP